MNAERLLAHYERIADAPDAISRLRRFVLDLAVRGKLVPQDPNDEPGWELVKRIAAEKARLVEAREIKEPKALEFPDTASSALPQNWALVSLGHVINRHLGGGTPSKNNPNYWNGSVLWASVKDVGKSKYLDETIDRITEEGLANSSSNLIPAGTLLVVTRMGLGKVSINRVPVAINQDLRALFLSSLVDIDYCYNFFLTHGFEGKGLTVKGIKIDELLRIPFPLPPLAEQHRIAAKVNELMALCDRLEAACAVREATRDRLAAASLARLKAPNAETLGRDVHFALHALPTLTARPDQINQLRQTILNLAIRGKLVPQDPNDEPASDLLTRIAAENKKLLVEKGIRPQKPALPAENFEVEAKIPGSWLHVYLQDIAYQITDGTHLTPKYTEQGKPFLSAQNVKPFKFMPEKHRLVSEIDFDNYRANRRPERGDILMTRVGAGIGEAAVLDSDFEFSFYVSLCLIKIPNRVLSANYLVLWLNSPEGRDSSTRRTYGKGASQGNLNLGLIRTFKIPLPPLAEQHRIVAKVDELMTLCNRLEATLTIASGIRRRLLDALLAGALALEEERELEAAE